VLIKDIIKRILLEQISATQKYYHGSSKPLEIGQVLAARERPTEFSNRTSKDGYNVEGFVDSYRPPEAVSRLKCVFAVDNVDDLNLAGASEDFVYEVEPIGKVTKAYFGWFSKVLVSAMSGKLNGNKSAEKAAENYWKGVPPKGYNMVREYLCDGFRVVRLVG
jgi:hypothetical protein